MLSYVCHVLKLSQGKILAYTLESGEDAYLIGKVTVIIYLAQRLCHLIPVNSSRIGQNVLVVLVIVIVDMQGLKSVVTKRSYKIPRLVSVRSGKTNVSDVKTSDYMIVVKCVNVAQKFIDLRAGIVCRKSAEIVPLEHIFDRNLYIELFGYGDKLTVVFHIHLEYLFLVALILHKMQGVNDRYLCSEQSGNLD